MKILGIIPARFGSSRLLGKPLIDILGKPMIENVYINAQKSTLLSKLIVATDDDRIFNCVQNFGGNVLMTNINHINGTNRCNEVVEIINEEFDFVINIQGDEPFIHPNQIDILCNLLTNTKSDIATLVKKETDNSISSNKNIVKAIVDENNFATNFVRILDNNSTNYIYKHIGIYGFKTNILKEICNLSPTQNEIQNSLEQLRWLDNNYKIKVAYTIHDAIAVDTKEDVEKIKNSIK